jgi:hypothetical protein
MTETGVNHIDQKSRYNREARNIEDINYFLLMTTTLYMNTTIVLHSIHNPTIKLYRMHQVPGRKVGGRQ